MALRDIVGSAVKDMLARGFSLDRLRAWIALIRQAAEVKTQPPYAWLDARLRTALRRALTPNSIKRSHKGLVRFGVEQIEPAFRSLLAERIRASAELIKLNREQRIAQTLDRFAGWASSVPVNPAPASVRKVTTHIAQPVDSHSYEVRRVAIDQGHKLAANINAVIAQQNEAIAFVWHDHGNVDKRYHARKAHLARSGKVFVVRGNWALKEGYMQRAGHQYTDEIEQPGELPMCRCWVTYLYAPSELPADMQTEKARRLAKAA